MANEMESAEVEGAGQPEGGVSLEVGLILATTIALVLSIVVGFLELKNYAAGILAP